MLKHVQEHREERRAFIARTIEAEQYPERVNFIIMDYTKPVLIPRSTKRVKDNSGRFIPLQIAGAISYSESVKMLFVHLPFHEKGSNNMVTFLFHYIVALNKAGRKRAPLLRIQADNAGGECKNIFFFSFLAYLVFQGFYKTIELSMLPAGHTHCDIDAHFSVLHRKVPFIVAPTPSALIEEMKEMYKTEKPIISVVEKIIDWKSFVTPHLEQLYNHSFVRFFRFEKTADGSDVLMTTKLLSKDPWSNESVRIFKSIPDGEPRLLTNEIAEDSAPLETSLKNAKDYLSANENDELLTIIQKGRLTIGPPSAPVAAVADEKLPIGKPCTIGGVSIRSMSDISWEELADSADSHLKKEMKIGDVVAVKSETGFFIAQIEDKSEDCIRVRWYDSRKANGRYVLVNEYDEISYDSIMMYNFSLTATGMIPAVVYKSLKAMTEDQAVE